MLKETRQDIVSCSRRFFDLTTFQDVQDGLFGPNTFQARVSMSLTVRGDDYGSRGEYLEQALLYYVMLEIFGKGPSPNPNGITPPPSPATVTPPLCAPTIGR
jgi:hypothetical protein